ncbi:MAG: flagellar assembly protein FliW [Peptoanaerobacter stomatis]|uniref:flagellar assembly protein FliW n=1 Tax=Peptoanaerobacter stomatis TaxID=796937 RepID=UPI003FA072AA
MKINTNYYGELEVKDEDILTLKDGMLGYEELNRFILIKEDDIFVEYLQAIDELVAFAVMDPFLVKQDYSFDVPDSVLKALDIKSEEDVVIKTVVVIPEDITKIRTNLQAPIVFNKSNNKGMQIILDDSYPIRYEFFGKEEK